MLVYGWIRSKNGEWIITLIDKIIDIDWKSQSHTHADSINFPPQAATCRWKVPLMCSSAEWLQPPRQTPRSLMSRSWSRPPRRRLECPRPRPRQATARYTRCVHTSAALWPIMATLWQLLSKLIRLEIPMGTSPSPEIGLLQPKLTLYFYIWILAIKLKIILYVLYIVY